MNVRKNDKSLSRWLFIPALGGALMAVAAVPGAALADEPAEEGSEDVASTPAEDTVDQSIPESPEDAVTELAACQNVKIRVKNNKSVKIKVLKAEYKSVEDGKWRKESLPNEVIRAGDTETVKSGAALERVEGHKMKSIRLHYKKWCGGKWSVTYKTTDSTFDKAKCVYGKTYRIDTSGGGC